MHRRNQNRPRLQTGNAQFWNAAPKSRRSSCIPSRPKRNGIPSHKEIHRELDLSRSNTSRSFRPPHWRDKQPGPTNAGLGDAFMGLHYTPGFMLSEQEPIDPKAVKQTFESLVDLDLLGYDWTRQGYIVTDLGHLTLLGKDPHEEPQKA